MSYEFESRVRYSEVDELGNIKYSAIINYLQDCTTFQSEDIGLGVSYLAKKNVAWVLNYWQIDIESLPKLADRIVVGTIPLDIKGFMGTRNFYIRDVATGKDLIKAYSVWTLIDLENLRPTRVDEKMLEGYVLGEKLEMEYLGRKINLAGEAGECEPVKITEYMLDTNHHVNNERYISLALSLMPKDINVKRIRAEYKDSAFLGDVLVPFVYDLPETIGVEFYKEGKKDACMKCEFTKG